MGRLRSATLGVLVLTLVASACQYDPGQVVGAPELATCDGMAATMGVGYQAGVDPVGGATYSGTPQDDVIVVANGPVTIDAGAGDDVICVNATGFTTGSGTITVIGGAGDDRIGNERSWFSSSDSFYPVSFVGGPGAALALGGLAEAPPVVLWNANAEVIVVRLNQPDPRHESVSVWRARLVSSTSPLAQIGEVQEMDFPLFSGARVVWRSPVGPGEWCFVAEQTLIGVTPPVDFDSAPACVVVPA